MYATYELDGLMAWAAWPAVALAVLFWGLRGRWGAWRTFGVLVLATYAVWIASVAFFPMPMGIEMHYWSWRSVNLVPFRSFIGSFRHTSLGYLVQIHGGNFLLFVPFTVVGPVLWTGMRQWSKVLAFGLSASLGIELAQLGLSAAVGAFYRSVDIDDVILNTAGALFGYGLYVLARRVARPQSPLGVT